MSNFDFLRAEWPRLFEEAAGQLTPAKQRKLLRWAAAHQGELGRNWYLARQGLPYEPIAPTVEED